MIWVCGSGRCGTLSFAHWQGWPHEPGEWELKPFLEQDQATCTEHIKECLKLDADGAVDSRFTFCLPQIQKLDPAARYIYLFRSPSATVRSWLHRWKGTYPHYFPQFTGGVVEKYARFWRWCYEKTLEQEGEYVEVQEIPKHLNRSDYGAKPDYRELKKVSKICAPLYRSLLNRMSDRRPTFHALV